MIKFEFDLDGTGNKITGYIYLDCYLLSSLDITNLIAKSTEDFDKWFENKLDYCEPKPVKFEELTLYPLDIAVAYWQYKSVSFGMRDDDAYCLIFALISKTLRHHFDIEFYGKDMVDFNAYDITDLRSPTLADIEQIF